MGRLDEEIIHGQGNKTGRNLVIIVEPEAANIDLSKGASVDIHLDLKTNEFSDKFTCIMEEDKVIIYECRQFEMKIIINDQLEHFTPAGRYWEW